MPHLLTSDRLTEIENKAKQWVECHKASDTVTLLRICEQAVTWNGLEVAFFCQQLVSWTESSQEASIYLTAFANRIGWTPVDGDRQP